MLRRRSRRRKSRRRCQNPHRPSGLAHCLAERLRQPNLVRRPVRGQRPPVPVGGRLPNPVGANCAMYSFLKIFIVVVLALVLIDWLAGQQAKSWTNIPNAPGWASLSSNIKIRSAMANESPQGTAPLLDETFLPGDIEYENPKGNVRIYFPIVTAIVLSVLIWLFASRGKTHR
jgi:hypothetical protein